MQRRPFLTTAAILAATTLALALLALTGFLGFLALAFFPAFALVVLLAYGPDEAAGRTTLPRALRTPTARPTPTRAPATLAPPTGNGAFHHAGFTLYARETNGRTLYFFAKNEPKSGTPSAKPAGYQVGVNGRTGLPFLKRGEGTGVVDLTPPPAPDEYRPQCSALRNDGVQCRNSARGGSKYCASHFGYQPRTAEGVVRLTDTASKVARRDTATSFAGDNVRATGRGAQCQALTAAGGGRAQCKNTGRPGSQFCGAHQGYRSPTPERVVKGRDSAPRVRGAPDTTPSVRRRTPT